MALTPNKSWSDTCHEHGVQNIVGMGADTVTLECGAVGSHDAYVHPQSRPYGLSDLVEMTAENDEERTLLHHVRGNCHNGAVCLICQASARANQAELRLESIISGDPLRLPTKADAMREVFPSLRLPLKACVDAFDAVLPKALLRSHPHWMHNRIMTVKWMRESEEMPAAVAIREHYLCLLADEDGTPDESGGC